MSQLAWGPRVLFSICGGFVAGILARSVFAFAHSGIFFMFIIALIALCAAIDARRRVAAGTIALFFCASALGAWRMEGAILRGDPFLDARIGETVALEGTVAQEPDMRESSIRLTVRADTASSTPIDASVLAVIPPYAKVSYGERVRVRGTLTVPGTFETTPGREFDYPGYLAVSGIGYTLERANVTVLAPARSTLTGAAIAAKRWYVHGLEAALPEPAAGLAAGITAGDKRGLGGEVSAEFRTTSLVHIVVLSGYNITVVANALMNALGFLPLVPRLAAGGFVAIFFSVMTGGAAASVRAAIMAVIAMTARVSGRLYAADRALAVAAAAMAAWDPYVVAFDPGYQLSVFATAGLIWISPNIAPYLARVPERVGLREIVLSTTSAQIAVMPLLLYQSGALSFVALPANFLVLAVVPLAMALSFFAGVVGSFASFAAPVAGLPALILLSYMLAVAHALSALPFSSLPIPAFSAFWLIPAYALIGWGVSRASVKEAAAPEGAAAEPRFARGI